MQLPYFTHNKYLLLGYLVCGYLLWVNPCEGPWEGPWVGPWDGRWEGVGPSALEPFVLAFFPQYKS